MKGMDKSRSWALLAVPGLMMLLSLGCGSSNPNTMPAPQGFEKHLVYMAAGRFNPDEPPPVEGDLAEWFHKEVMGRSDAEIDAEKARAEAFFETQFGPGLPEAMPFGLDPREEYRVYISSGEPLPSEGWVIRDGGFMIQFQEGTTVHGSFGGNEGRMVPANSMIVFGEYNIDRSNSGNQEPLIIHYRSASPIMMSPDMPGFMFDCIVESEQYGDGRAQGLSIPQEVNGKQQSNIRTQLTFPPYGPSVDH